uniref:NEDD8-activating enzyme E1 catalytic subunit n=2 Tax=Macrostomum lignano TaxID=282301 RepID=A0A1I8HX37_9PLAT
SSPGTDNRWRHVRRLLERAGPLGGPEFEPDPELFSAIRSDLVQILVVGAGGLGCEMLKDLALSGFVNLHLIDMDTIDLSNLNRQFLFRPKDIGRPKAVVAAEFVERRVSGCRVTPHFGKLEDKPLEFYKQFMCIVCGLDSVQARRRLNQIVCSLVQFDESDQPIPTSVIPLIDGGTQGFQGHCRVVRAHATPCLECTADLYSSTQQGFPLCTLAHTPRLPEHCIEFARIMQWPQEWPFGEEVPVDGDDPHHVDWIRTEACKRARQFGIREPDFRLTQGVVKHIIPAVASTNAVISAQCVTEVFKAITGCYPLLNNFANFSDIEGVAVNVVPLERNPQCDVCGQPPPKPLTFNSRDSLQTVINQLKSEHGMTRPSLTACVEGRDVTLYMDLSFLRDQLADNLDKSLAELGLLSNTVLNVTDSAQSGMKPVTFVLNLEDGMET